MPAPRYVFMLAPFYFRGTKNLSLGIGRGPTGTGSRFSSRRKRLSNPSAARALGRGGDFAAPELLAGPRRPAAGWRGGAMKLYSLSVFYKAESKVVLLKTAQDVSSFSFFQRSR